MLVYHHHPGLLFQVHPTSQKKKKFFEMEKIALIVIYNIFVTKNNFWNMNIKKYFDPHVSCRPDWVVANQHNSKSGLRYHFVKFLKTITDDLN